MTRDGLMPPASPLPSRPEDGHKGIFGTVLVIGGCDDDKACMVGGPSFAAIGALRAGAGRAILATPRTILSSCLEVAPSATGLPLSEEPSQAVACVMEMLPQVQAVIIGPGLGASERSRALVTSVLQSDDSPPIVLDADGLNVFASEAGHGMTFRNPVVLTPHPGEYDRLAEALNLPLKPRSAGERVEAARKLSGCLNAVCVLKGQGTVVASNDKSWTCERGSVVLATGGTGDVLAGIIGGLLAQGVHADMSDPWDLAAWGTWIHAVAGEQWASRNGSAGMLAADLAEEVPAVMSQVPRA